MLERSFCKVGHLYLYYDTNSSGSLLKVDPAQVSPLKSHRCRCEKISLRPLVGNAGVASEYLVNCQFAGSTLSYTQSR